MTNNNEELIKVLKQSEKEALSLKNEFVGTEHLLLALLSTNNRLKDILLQNNLSYSKCKNEVNHGKARPKPGYARPLVSNLR